MCCVLCLSLLIVCCLLVVCCFCWVRDVILLGVAFAVACGLLLSFAVGLLFAVGCLLFVVNFVLCDVCCYLFSVLLCVVLMFVVCCV